MKVDAMVKETEELHMEPPNDKFKDGPYIFMP
jgi:hypothetical protein